MILWMNGAGEMAGILSGSKDDCGFVMLTFGFDLIVQTKLFRFRFKYLSKILIFLSTQFLVFKAWNNNEN